jgi:hypothetical protein
MILIQVSLWHNRYFSVFYNYLTYPLHFKLISDTLEDLFKNLKIIWWQWPSDTVCLHKYNYLLFCCNFLILYIATDHFTIFPLI